MRHFQCKRCNWFAQGPRRSVEASLVRHLRQVHGIAAPPSTVTATQTQSMARPPPINTIPTMADAFEQAICDFIVDTLQPFDLVKTPSFCRIFEGRGVHLPTVEGIREHILRDLDIYYAVLRSELDSTCVSLSLSIGRLSRSNDTSLFVISGCWITPDFQYRERLFDVCGLPGMTLNI